MSLAFTILASFTIAKKNPGVELGLNLEGVGGVEAQCALTEIKNIYKWLKGNLPFKYWIKYQLKYCFFASLPLYVALF